MVATYTLISSNVLSGTAASVTFSSIPNTYTDLVLRVSARTDRAATISQEMRLRFNGSTSTIYSNTGLYGANSTATSEIASAQNALFRVRQLPAADATANTFGSIEVYVPSYLASQNKPISSFGANENNTAADGYVDVNAGLWGSTAAITQIDCILPSGNFVSGSSFYLYGIKNS